ncbi:hypothetical protein [Oceaniglobus indicus]|uniref:hypothetical protein n=1 Tax=Oceaniglobus indicus TaxID=2047749 RepID=UPI0011AB6EB3|nr:hypothetical protein [Oceaniglobus indicus]
MSEPSHAIRLFGTEEAVEPPRVLRAGKLSAELVAGNLRYIRWDGAEVLRAVSFIVRDKDWGTYNPKISDLEVEESDDRFTVTFSAIAADDEQSFAYDARIEGRADGTLTFHGTGHSDGGFLTNRTGFVILHPIDGIAGEPVEITRTDGTVEPGTFPAEIDPLQPMMDLRALSHTAPSGLRVTCLMEGDTYEMEDQRNWSDASYKTYVRPLALPWPYRIEPGEQIDQTITVTVSGDTTGGTATDSAKIAPGAKHGVVPPLGMGLRPEDVAGTQGGIDRLKDLAPAYLILHHDPRAGHGKAELAAQLDIVRALGCNAWLEAVIVATDDAGATAEVAHLGALAADLGDPFETVLVSPAPDMKCTLPGSEWPETPDAATLYDATRAAFPEARIGGGMFSYFTELNRKRPPVSHLDLVSFTTSPMVHAGDDRSVMETHEAHPAIALTAKVIAANTPWAVGPSAIGVRDNPYGEAAKDNPDNIRQAMNINDPRQRGLFGAVWNLGYFADFAAGGAAAIALGAPTGAFGAIAAPADFPQPGFDDGDLFPVFHVLRGLRRLAGQEMRALDLPAAGPLTGLAADTGEGIEIWVANKTADPVDVSIAAGAGIAVLDADSFTAAATDPAFMDRMSDHETDDETGTLTLSAHATARILLRHPT